MTYIVSSPSAYMTALHILPLVSTLTLLLCWLCRLCLVLHCIPRPGYLSTQRTGVWFIRCIRLDSSVPLHIHPSLPNGHEILCAPPLLIPRPFSCVHSLLQFILWSAAGRRGDGAHVPHHKHARPDQMELTAHPPSSFYTHSPCTPLCMMSLVASSISNALSSTSWSAPSALPSFL